MQKWSDTDKVVTMILDGNENAKLDKGNIPCKWLWQLVKIANGSFKLKVVNPLLYLKMLLPKLYSECKFNQCKFNYHWYIFAKVMLAVITKHPIPLSGDVATSEIANDAVLLLESDNVVTNKIANDAVTTNKIATNAVTTTKILDGNVTTDNSQWECNRR
ncbi:MAG: hypothetical protein IPH46_10115 [Bacteroidetes bacterium]|nr:hypothetical protein [Bacteroidota bacterium]